MDFTKFRTWYHRHPTEFLLLGAVIAVVLVLYAIDGIRGSSAAPMKFLGTRFQVIGFYENKTTGSSRPSSWTALQNHWRSLTTITPRWLAVDPTGHVVNLGYDAKVVTFAHQHHILVVPLVTNAGGASTVLFNAGVRRLAASTLATLVRHDHLDGLNIDFELLKPSARADLTSFVAQLRHDLGARKVLAVSVFPLVGLPPAINGADDYAGLARWANYLVIMAYDHHYSGGPPGPVAPYAWVRDNILALKKLVPAPKLVLAIGMYGYDWVNNQKPGPATTLSDVQAKALAKKLGVKPVYNASLSQTYFTYKSGPTTHIVWYMGDRSAAARAKLAQQTHLAGIGLWRLGDEDPGFWTSIATP